MNTAKGQTRFVIAFPNIGFVIKLPRIKKKVITEILNHIKKRRWKRLQHHWSAKITNPYGYKNKIFGGILANISEFYFWKKTKNISLFPTWFSFFGLFNIQKYGKPLGHEAGDVCFVISKLTNTESLQCGHTFDNPQNYTSKHGCLRIIDYADSSCWKVIEKYGNKIVEVSVKDCAPNKDNFIKYPKDTP